jgi:hypothetical protein
MQPINCISSPDQASAENNLLEHIWRVRYDFLQSLDGLGSLASFETMRKNHEERPHPLGVAMSKIVDLALLLYGTEVAQAMYKGRKKIGSITSPKNALIPSKLMKMICIDIKHYRDILSLAIRGRFPLVPIDIAVEVFVHKLYFWVHMHVFQLQILPPSFDIVFFE